MIHLNYIDKQFQSLTDHLKSLSKEEIFEQTKNAFFNINPQIQTSIEDYFKKFPYWGKLDCKNQEYEHFDAKVETLSDHLNELIWLYNKLSDYRSKKLLLAILNNWYQYDFTTLDSSHEKNYSHYFDLDLVSCKDEVFVDLGAYIGDTVLDFIHTYGSDSYKKIYAYEISSDTIEYLKQNTSPYPNIEIRTKAVIDQISTMYLGENSVDASANTVEASGTQEIETTSLDLDIEEPITMIKMDIEGSEQQALIGAKNHIQREHPKLLISVYHNLVDLWKIPTMIEEMCPDTYHFYLRSYGGSIFPTEIVLLAIPQNKNTSTK